MVSARYVTAAAVALSLSLPATAGISVWLTQKQYDVAQTFPNDISVHIIDEAERLEEEIFGPVSRASSAQAAEQAAFQIFRSPDWPQKEARLKQAWETVARADTLGIEKTPAVVIDDQLVVYGTTRTEDARRLAAQYRTGGDQ